MPNRDNPSLKNSTWDYLFNNFTKSQLQNHCRQLGLSMIWQTKEKLIDMIMKSRQSTWMDDSSHNHEDQSSDLLAKIIEELDSINEKLGIKYVEIEQLNEIIQNAHITINRLNQGFLTRGARTPWGCEIAFHGVRMSTLAARHLICLILPCSFSCNKLQEKV